jgi:tetratricopeptide (TPR) repeat protein
LQWMVQRNRVLLALRNTAELRRSLDRILPHVRLPELLLQDALLKMMEHDFAGARKAAEEVLSQSPEDATAAKILVDCYTAERQPIQARDTLVRLVAAHPKSAPLHNLMAEWYLRTGDPAGARKEWESAKAADPKFLQADLALAGLDRVEKHSEAAMQRLLSIVAVDHNSVPALLQMASLEEESGNAKEAIATYRKVLEVDGTNLTAMNNLAYHLALENPDEALKLAQQAVEAAPDSPDVQDTLGWVFYRKGIYATATGYLKLAYTKSPTPQRQFHLAMSYLKQGEKSLGQQMLATALQKDPNLIKTEQGW